MFGPDVRMLSGRTIVICREGDPTDRAVVQALFADTSARLVELDSAEHDRRMSLVLGLTHLANLVFARALSRSGVAAEELAEVAGVTFSKQLATTREVAGENPELYFEIQSLNRLTGATGRQLAAAAEELIAAVEAGEGERFAEIMGEADRFLSGTSQGDPR
jgi:chorismate mutase/prephenate dehydrogenase